MSQPIKLNSPQTLFIIKTAACFAALLVGFFALSQTASMQNQAAPPPPPMPMNTAVVVNSGSSTMSNGNYATMGNYKPTPEPPKSTVRGRVIYADTGRAVRRAGLMLMSMKGAGSREVTGLTNERGEFEIKNVAEGRYFMSVSTPGVLSPFSALGTLDQMRPDNFAPAAADISRDFQEIAVNGINDTDVTITVKRGAAVTGRIMYADGAEAAGVRVEVLRKKDGQFSPIITSLGDVFGAILGGSAGGLRTDDRGVFRVAGLPAGEYVVRVVENVMHAENTSGRGDGEFMAIWGFSPSSMVATYYPNASEAKKAEIIKLELGQEQAEINITLPDRALHDLKGVVVNKATRAPLKNVEISLKSENDVASIFGAEGGFGKKNTTDEQGRWSYKQLPAGKYTLTAKSGESETSYANAAANETKPKQPKFAETQMEIVVEDKDAEDLTVELAYGATISGTVSFDDGQPFSQPLFVTASDENGKFSDSNYISSVSYDETGAKPVLKKTHEFQIEGIAAGKVFVNARAGSDETGDEKSGRFYVKSITFGGRDISRATVETRAGEEIKGVQIILSRAVGTLKGNVVKADKSPAAGAKVWLVSTDKGLWENIDATLYDEANADGEFEVAGAPGEYFIILYKEQDSDDEDKDAGKSFKQIRREWLEKVTADAQKVTIKAKETEKITLTMP